MPGWTSGSWGYRGNDGKIFHQTGRGIDYGPTYGAEDVVGCGINFTTNSAFFTKNGRYLGKQRNVASAGDVANFSVGEAFSDLRGRLLPMCGVGQRKTKLSVNFGDRPFVFQEIESP